MLCRVAGAALPQPILFPLSVLLPITLVVQLTGSDGAELSTVVATPVVLILWLVGVSAHAEVGQRGVRWRYYLRHDIPWADVERISLTVTGMGWGARHSIVVRSGGRDHRITPAAPPGRGRIDFARQLFAYAEAAGVPASNEGWARV